MLLIKTLYLYAFLNFAKMFVPQVLLDSYLRAMHRLFKDSPARRADYISINQTETFPLKFCQVRWVENVSVAERAQEVLPYVKKYVENSKRLPGNVTTSDIHKLCADKLADAKILFFASVGAHFEPFLKKYQTSDPQIPFLYDDISLLLRSVASRFVKQSILQDADNAAKLMKLDFSSADIKCHLKDVDIGVAAKRALGEAKASELEAVQFRKEMCSVFVGCISKACGKKPTQIQLGEIIIMLSSHYYC